MIKFGLIFLFFGHFMCNKIEKCGSLKSSSTSNIFAFQGSTDEEDIMAPWLAAVGRYTKTVFEDLQVSCSGVVMTRKIILTAAHCFEAFKAPNKPQLIPTHVRVGANRIDSRFSEDRKIKKKYQSSKLQVSWILLWYFPHLTWGGTQFLLEDLTNLPSRNYEKASRSEYCHQCSGMGERRWRQHWKESHRSKRGNQITRGVQFQVSQCWLPIKWNSVYTIHICHNWRRTQSSVLMQPSAPKLGHASETAVVQHFRSKFFSILELKVKSVLNFP